MQEYLKISFILSLFGLLKETRPSEPFITDFIKDYKNVTLEEIYQEIFPIGTYSYLIQLGIIFLLTDLMRYKPLIILNAIAGIIIWSLLSFEDSFFSLKIVESVYGTYQACEISYFAYIYAKTKKENFQIVTSHTRAAILIGRFISAISSQLLAVQFQLLDYRQLNYLTLIAQLIALLWAFFIPSVERSLYFHQKENEIHHQNRFHQAFQLIREHFINSFKNHTVIIWSIYYAITVCFYNQIIAYIQVLWITIDDTQKYNGYVDAILTSSSAIFSLLAGKIHINFLKNQNHALLVLIMMSSLQGIFVIFASMSQSLIACYIYYICYGISYAFGITICATEIASNLPQDTYGLIFGFNTLIGLIIQTIVTYTFVSSGFLLPPREQYEIYSYFFFGLAVIFIIIFIARKFKKL